MSRKLSLAERITAVQKYIAMLDRQAVIEGVFNGSGIVLILTKNKALGKSLGLKKFDNKRYIFRSVSSNGNIQIAEDTAKEELEAFKQDFPEDEVSKEIEIRTILL